MNSIRVLRKTNFLPQLTLIFASAAVTYVATGTPLKGQTGCSGTTPPCVLTGQNGNLRQAYNPSETGITPSTVANLVETSFSPLQLTSDPLPSGTNQVYTQPLYVAGVSTSLSNCTPSCNMLIVNASGSGPENGTCATSPGLTPTDYGDIFAFAAPVTVCPDATTNPATCDRITSLAFYKDGSPEMLYYWPKNETLTGLQLSNNSAVAGTGSISGTSGSSTVTGSGTQFTQQLIVGDVIVAAGQTRVVTAISSNTSLTVSPALTSTITSSSFTYDGYFINPIFDTNPMGDNVTFPGGTVSVTANGSSGAVVWGLANLTTGGSTLFAYDSGLNIKWCSNAMTYCNNGPGYTKQATFTLPTFSLPTVVNAHVYIPTSGIQKSANTSSCATTTCSGLLVYHLSN